MNGSAARGRVVVVTGASGGVGRAVVRAFAARGDRLALIARGGAGLEGAVRDAEERGARALAIEADVADPEAVEAAAQRAEDELGPLDIWVNVAFTSVFAPFTEIDPDEFRRVTEVSYLGYVYGTHAALRRMLPRDRGTLVHAGSALAYRGIPLQSAYCGAKHAIQGWHEALRCELLASGTRVRTTMVQLPALDTPQFDWVLSRLPRRARPVAPIYRPELAARAIVYAADHPRRREYWVGGSTAATLMANAVAPGLLDRYLARTGFDSQQTDTPRPADEPANLWEPADTRRDFGAHGRFAASSHQHSFQWWATRHRGALAAATLCGAGAASLAWARRAGD
ncbi:SDR family oxidoreductase [Streptomyces sp. A1136]|uniref:SDR family oxidoreductase n=1 Tax=Streptomyces sp. A1136 TaxID=2563102 RepID=UPI00109E7AF2|nr:SDR family oxidoreductase [Streptomyces sp. A1136]THA57540.1 SDR family NAD(P)-dependent oxidoreductase [Streptomyces sp. A1136]